MRALNTVMVLVLSAYCLVSFIWTKRIDMENAEKWQYQAKVVNESIANSRYALQRMQLELDAHRQILEVYESELDKYEDRFGDVDFMLTLKQDRPQKEIEEAKALRRIYKGGRGGMGYYMSVP